MATWSLAGRAAAGQWTPLAVTSALLRLFAMSVWFGGLALVAVSLSPAARAADLAQVLPRFSTLAFTSVVVLVVTGAFQSWREVGSLAALPTTTFGRVLLAKLCGVVLLVALGNLARRRVQRHVAAPEPVTAPVEPRVVSRGGAAVLERVEATTDAHSRPPDVRALRRGVLAELVIGAAVLGFTAALVATVSARQAYVQPFEHTVTADGLRVSLTVDSPRTEMPCSASSRPPRTVGRRRCRS
jgi:copper transport protein